MYLRLECDSLRIGGESKERGYDIIIIAVVFIVIIIMARGNICQACRLLYYGMSSQSPCKRSFIILIFIDEGFRAQNVLITI